MGTTQLIADLNQSAVQHTSNKYENWNLLVKTFHMKYDIHTF
jgi:hypothetical protein